MRGKRVIEDGLDTTTRITPAGAGKTLRCVLWEWRAEDHPRRCGENFDVHIIHPTQIGSPPQVRGKRRYLPVATTAVRITPAGAGKTAKALTNPIQCRDHPRRCGENAGETDEDHAAAGSPPQVRGKLGSAWTNLVTGRITPAGAGKTRKPC